MASWLQRLLGRTPPVPPSPNPPAPEDAEFLGSHPAWSASELGRALPEEATGLFLTGPRSVSYADALSTEGLFLDRALPQFVVVGCYTFDRSQLNALTADPLDSIEVVVRGPGIDARQTLRLWEATYEYDAVGISRSPDRPPEWVPPGDEPGFVSMGGEFALPMGLHTPEPVDGPYELEVFLECGALRSETLRIAVGP